MGRRTFHRCGIAVVALILMTGSAAVQYAVGQTPAPAEGDIELAKPPKYPQLISPTVEGGQLLDTHHGEPMLVQEFTFDPAKKEVALAKNSPMKQRMYADARIDSTNYTTDLTLFDYLTIDRKPIGKIVLTSAKKKITVSPNYVITPTKDKPTPIDPATYQAAVQFTKGEESNKPGTTLTMRRNSAPPAPLADATFSKISRKNDVITWTIERGGAVVATGSFGFPVVATDTDLVRYVIALP